ncbi:helix-turn-helix domain-containing protein [Helicobacter sp. 13S00477-4]|uniref:helix-turn-helix domain-containing protein n=1 Tax=Helicobacter sp. 13S00477-4 TaxID=1905759 RepID=UPI000BA74E78|nr:helix-turn-helix domain-containing protein [Helicobacter sp. 13S00477-4]PAF52667.1 hypothetical protein BKH44_00320 [Helicobacter sp. 13S00477-4]
MDTIKIPSGLKDLKGIESFPMGRFCFARYTQKENSIQLPILMEMNVLIFVCRGKKILHTEGNDFCIESGEAIFLSKGYYTLSDIIEFQNDIYQSFLFFFDDSLLIEFINKHRYILEAFKNHYQEDIIFKIQTDKILQSVLEGFAPYFELPKSPNENIILLKFEEIFLHILNNQNQNRAFIGFLRNIIQEFNVDIKKLFEYCNHNFSNVSEMAMFSKMDLASFSRKFKQCFGISPKEWLDEKRFSKAKFLIQFSQRNITQICQECGFSSPAWFIERFKTKYGITPKQYQKSNNLYFVS